jgi:hypothetical protein
MTTANIITPSSMRDMGFTLFDRSNSLWWEQQHPTIPELRFVVAAMMGGDVRSPAECMTLHGYGEEADSCLFAGFCTEDQIRTLAAEMCAMEPNAVRIMVLALSR